MRFRFVKNLGFKEAKEWRAVACSTIGHYNILSSDSIVQQIKWKAGLKK